MIFGWLLGELWGLVFVVLIFLIKDPLDLHEVICAVLSQILGHLGVLVRYEAHLGFFIGV